MGSDYDITLVNHAVWTACMQRLLLVAKLRHAVMVKQIKSVGNHYFS